MAGDTFSFSGGNFSFQNFNLDDLKGSCYVDEDNNIQEIADVKNEYNNTMVDSKYEHYTGDSVFGEDYSDNDYDGWNG